jgi:hypothetical protein
MKKKTDENPSVKNKKVRSTTKKITDFLLNFFNPDFSKEKQSEKETEIVQKSIFENGEYPPQYADAEKKENGHIELKPLIAEEILTEDPKDRGREYFEKDLKSSQEAKRQSKDFDTKIQAHDGNFDEESDIVIGFDFGTSSSKIVIRDSARKTAYAVPFNIYDNTAPNSYLAPTRIFLNDDGELDLFDGKYFFSEIKVNLMENSDKWLPEFMDKNIQVSALELASGYMALLIRYARSWFLNHTKHIYRNSKIFWHINLGIPSGKYYDPPKAKVFKMMVMAAWRISRDLGTITIQIVEEKLKNAKSYIDDPDKLAEMESGDSLWLHSDFINTHPEVIMEVVGYAKSPMRKDGLHLLVDIGASTLDAATFIIHNQDGEDVYHLLETRVKKLGTMVLHSQRIMGLKETFEKNLRDMNEIDPLNVLPDQSYYKIEPQNNVHETDSDFFQKCSVLIGEIVRETKNRRDPFSNAWEKGLAVFICGGGGRFIGYKDAIEKRGKSIKKGVSNFAGFIFQKIPQPDHFIAPDLSSNDYDRLAVAYGLSFTVDEIGEVVPENKNVDIVYKTRKANIDNKYVSKDVC